MPAEKSLTGSVQNDKSADVGTTFVQDEDYGHNGHVEAKYMGTLADQRDMSVLGRTQVLRVRRHEMVSLKYIPLTMHSGIFASSQSWALGAPS